MTIIKPTIILFEHHNDNAYRKFVIKNVVLLKQRGYNGVGYEAHQDHNIDRLIQDNTIYMGAANEQPVNIARSRQIIEFLQMVKKERFNFYSLDIAFNDFLISAMSMIENGNVAGLFGLGDNQEERNLFARRDMFMAMNIVQAAQKCQGLIVIMGWRHNNVQVELQKLGYNNFVSFMMREDCVIRPIPQELDNVTANKLQNEQNLEKLLLENTARGSDARAIHFPAGVRVINNFLYKDLDSYQIVIEEVARKPIMILQKTLLQNAFRTFSKFCRDHSLVSTFICASLSCLFAMNLPMVSVSTMQSWVITGMSSFLSVVPGGNILSSIFTGAISVIGEKAVTSIVSGVGITSAVKIAEITNTCWTDRIQHVSSARSAERDL